MWYCWMYNQIVSEIQMSEDTIILFIYKLMTNNEQIAAAVN